MALRPSSESLSMIDATRIGSSIAIENEAFSRPIERFEAEMKDVSAIIAVEWYKQAMKEYYERNGIDSSFV